MTLDHACLGLIHVEGRRCGVGVWMGVGMDPRYIGYVCHVGGNMGRLNLHIRLLKGRELETAF